MADVEANVVRRHPNSNNRNKNARRVKQTTAKKHQNSNQGKNHGENHHPNAKTITLKNGWKTKCHHSFRSDDDDFKSLTKEQKKTLHVKCWAAANQKPDGDNWKKEQEKLESWIVESVMSQIKDAGSVFLETTQQQNGSPGSLSLIVGGCNSQDKQNEWGQNE